MDSLECSTTPLGLQKLFTKFCLLEYMHFFLEIGFVVFIRFSENSQNPKYLNATVVELCCLVWKPLATYTYLHLISLKINKVKNSFPHLHISSAQ